MRVVGSSWVVSALRRPTIREERPTPVHLAFNNAMLTGRRSCLDTTSNPMRDSAAAVEISGVTRAPCNVIAYGMSQADPQQEAFRSLCMT